MNTSRDAFIAAISLVAAQILTSSSFAAEVYTDLPPPTPRVERPPPPRDGYTWGAGHWAWSGKSYYWVDGSWVVQRRHMHWITDQWEQVQEKWHWLPAHWQRDP